MSCSTLSASACIMSQLAVKSYNSHLCRGISGGRHRLASNVEFRYIAFCPACCLHPGNCGLKTALFLHDNSMPLMQQNPLVVLIYIVMQQDCNHIILSHDQSAPGQSSLPEYLLYSMLLARQPRGTLLAQTKHPLPSSSSSAWRLCSWSSSTAFQVFYDLKFTA